MLRGYGLPVDAPSVPVLREAIANGSIEQMLDWREVHAGESYYVPAGTVHAIGAGLTICEIQQNSDITYRFYDYNRPGTDGQPRAPPGQSPVRPIHSPASTRDLRPAK